MHQDTHEALARFVAREVPVLAPVCEYLVFSSTAPDTQPGFPRVHHTGGQWERTVVDCVLEARRGFLNDDVESTTWYLGIAFHWIADDFCPSASHTHGDPEAHAQFERRCAAEVEDVLAELRGVGGLQRPRDKRETLGVVSWVFQENRTGNNTPHKALNNVARTCVCLAASVCQSKRSKVLDATLRQLAEADRQMLNEIEQERERALWWLKIREVQIRRTKPLWWLFAPQRRWWGTWRANHAARLAAVQTRRQHQARFDEITTPHKGWYLFDVTLRNI